MDELKDLQDTPLDEEAEPQAEEELSEAERLKEQYENMRALAAQAQADGINYRNWAEREMKRLKAQGSERALLALLPVFDNLERALDSANDNPASIVEGLRMVSRQFLSAMTSLGVKEINPIGELFSPLNHDAMGMVPVSDKEQDGLIQQVVQKGFQLADKVIRPASVLVGCYQEPAKETAQDEQ